MNLGNYNISNLTEVLYRAMLGVSKNTFAGSRPKVYDKMKDFVVVSFPNRVYDNLGMGNTNCVIELHARDVANGVNMPKLSSMQEDVYARLPIEDDRYIIHSPISQYVGADNLGFHAIIIYCKVTIK
jgi:hypothetical protein